MDDAVDNAADKEAHENNDNNSNDGRSVDPNNNGTGSSKIVQLRHIPFDVTNMTYEEYCDK